MRNLLRRIAAMAALGSALGALAAGNTLSAPQITVTALPTTVSVPIALAVDRPLAALGFSLEFNADYLETMTALVTPVAARFASATPPVSLDVVAGRITWSAADFTGETVILAGSGPLVSVQFTVKAALAGAPGQSALLHLTGVTQIYDTNLNGVTIGTVQDGSVSIDNLPPTVTVTAITPASGINTGTVSITNLTGAGFQPGATVRLTRGTLADIPATSVAVANATRLTCAFDLTGKALGLWNVVVANPDAQTATLVDGFNVVPPILHTLTVNSLAASHVQIDSTTGHGGFTNYTWESVVHGTTVCLTVPSTDPAGYTFQLWRLDGVAHPAGQKLISFPMTADVLAEAVYSSDLPGPHPADTDADSHISPAELQEYIYIPVAISKTSGNNGAYHYDAGGNLQLGQTKGSAQATTTPPLTGAGKAAPVIARRLPAGYQVGTSIPVELSLNLLTAYPAASTCFVYEVLPFTPAAGHEPRTISAAGEYRYASLGAGGPLLPLIVWQFTVPAEITAAEATLRYDLEIPAATAGDLRWPTGDPAGRSAAYVSYSVGLGLFTEAFGGDSLSSATETSRPHEADQDGNWSIDMSPDLTRLIQFFNTGSYHCQAGTEDGYAPGVGTTAGAAHQADQNHDWIVQLSPDLTRMIQFHNSGGYHCEAGSEDGYAPGLAGGKAPSTTSTLTSVRQVGTARGDGGGTLEVSVTLTCSTPTALTSLAVQETLPPGWVFRGVMGRAAPEIVPAVGATGTLGFAWIRIPTAWPVRLTYRVAVPTRASTAKGLDGKASFRAAGGEIAVATSTSPAVGTTASGQGWFDLSGAYATEVAGYPLTLTVVHDTRGRLTGTAALRVGTDAAALVLSMPIRGGTRGSGGALLASLSAAGHDAAGGVRATLTLGLALDSATRQLSGSVTGSIVVGATPTPVSQAVRLDLPAAMDGTWALRFAETPAAAGSAGSAVLTLSNGVEHRFAVTSQVVAGTAILTLSGSPGNPPARGIRIRATTTVKAGTTALSTLTGSGYGQRPGW